ncbi:MAG: hypothetical protein U0176_24405 [Bacteroidia bacterium]
MNIQTGSLCPAIAKIVYLSATNYWKLNMGKRIAIASARIFCLLTLSMWAAALSGQSFQTHALTPGMWTGGLDWGDYDADGDLTLPWEG